MARKFVEEQVEQVSNTASPLFPALRTNEFDALLNHGSSIPPNKEKADGIERKVCEELEVPIS